MTKLYQNESTDTVREGPANNYSMNVITWLLQSIKMLLHRNHSTIQEPLLLCHRFLILTQTAKNAYKFWMTNAIGLEKYRCLILMILSIVAENETNTRKTKEINKMLITSEWLMQSDWKTIGDFLSWYQAFMQNMKPICQELYELSRHLRSVDRLTDRRTEKAITIGLLHFQCRALIKKW